MNHDLGGDCISRTRAIERLELNFPISAGADNSKERYRYLQALADLQAIRELPPQEPKIGHCKDCKYFEYDSVAKVDGIPLIVAHEICKRWGDGCKTKEDGYCFLFEPQESEDQDD